MFGLCGIQYMAQILNGKITDDTPTNVISEVGQSATVGLKESIKRNTEFNNRLEFSQGERGFLEAPVIQDVNSDKLNKIEKVLKDKGMDSQQREQALSSIREILEG